MPIVGCSDMPHVSLDLIVLLFGSALEYCSQSAHGVLLAKCARVRTKVRNELPFTGHSYGATRAVFYHQYYKQYTPTELRQNVVVPKERPVCNSEESTRRSSVGAPCWGIAIILHMQGHTSTLGDMPRILTRKKGNLQRVFSSLLILKVV